MMAVRLRSDPGAGAILNSMQTQKSSSASVAAIEEVNRLGGEKLVAPQHDVGMRNNVDGSVDATRMCGTK